MSKPRIFISHVSEEAKLAGMLKAHLTSDFLGMLDVFVSSDTESILAGRNWLQSIDEALRAARLELVLCSPVSVKRPWINFEAGAGWMRGIPIVPICHSGLELRQLPMPLAVLQAVTASSPEGIASIYTAVAKELGSAVPRFNESAVLRNVAEFESEYAAQVQSLTKADLSRERDILGRMRQALEDPKFRFRSVERLGILGGVSEGEAADLLRRDTDVVFSKGESGRMIARLSWR